MENRLEGQDIQGDELFIDLTPEELEELKGGGLPSYSYSILKPFPNGVPAIYILKKGLDISIAIPPIAIPQQGLGF
ncbi:hypothetical protein [Nostoc sp.]